MKLSNAILQSGDLDYDDPEAVAEFILPTRVTEKLVEIASDEASQATKPPTVTTPQDKLDRSTSVPPQLVEEVAENIDALRPVARSMAAINLHNLFMKMQHPSAGVKEKLSFQELLNDMGGLVKVKGEAAVATGSGFSITINLPQMGTTLGNTIEAKATRLVDDIVDE